MADYLNIAGRIRTTASDGVAMEAQEVKDLNQNKSQQEINADVQTELGDRYTKEETYSKEQLDDLITTPDVNYVSVVATDATTAVTDVLPATGEADTIYRVGNWNGTQYDSTMYALFAWNGTTYVCLAVRSLVGEVYDISVNHPDGQGNPTPYADLAAALGSDGENIPAGIRRGGMSIKFIQSSDNKYVQARLMADSFTTDVTQWQGVDDEPTPESHNLIESGVVADKFNQISVDSVGLDINVKKYVTTTRALVKFLDVNIKSGTKFKATVSGTAVWSRLWIACNNDASIRLQDEVVSETEYTIIAPVDITSIDIELYNVTTAGSVELRIVTDNIVDKKLGNIDYTLLSDKNVNATVNKTDIKAENPATGAFLSNGQLDTTLTNFRYQIITIDHSKAYNIKLINENYSYSNFVLFDANDNPIYFTGNSNARDLSLVFPSSIVKFGVCANNEHWSSEELYSCDVERPRTKEETDALMDSKISASMGVIASRTINLFDINAPIGQESRFDGYLNGSHTGYKSAANFKMTPYIDVTEGLDYIASINGTQYDIRFAYFYTDKSLDAFVSSVDTLTTKVTVPTGLDIRYARFVFADMQTWNEKLMVEQSSTVHPFVHYGYNVRNDSLDAGFIGGLSRQYNNILGSLRGANAQLNAGSVLTLPVTHVHKYFCLNARIHGAFDNIYVGVGRNTRYGYWVELTASQAIVHFYYNSDMVIQTENHGLTIGEDTSVTIFSSNNNPGQAKIVIVSNGSQYSFNVTDNFDAGGAGFLQNNNTSGSIDVELSFTAQKINSPVWIFGDSYTYPTYADRTWTKWLIEWSGEEPWLGNQQPGINSVSSYTDLLNLLQIGKPRYLVWCLGMNGGPDVDSITPNVAWKEAVDNVMALCQNYGITLILATIPNVPTINHEAKNAYVKASGYRYIDFAKAVGAETFIEGVSTWYGDGTDYDYLESATPRIHASAFGGKALANQVLQDFPEIICLNH